MECKDCNYFDVKQIGVIKYHYCIHEDAKVVFQNKDVGARLMSYQDAEGCPDWCPLKNKNRE
jgi:hypothetical protein